MRFFTLFLALIVCFQITAQTDSTLQNKDLKIGLVFSGGGAKALAAIGALKVIENAGIKPDYIGGTSMGGIIGALYSLGYSADEIEQYLRRVDWDALMVNEIPRNRLSYFDRKFSERYLLNLPVINNKVTLPSGINYAQYILKELSYLTQQSYQYPSFSDFPTPFLCVATNLQTGKAKVFEDIRLVDALRATSAFPSLFTPYEIDDTLYVDGGVVNNFPVSIVADKGMDVIIGIDVQKFVHQKEDLTTVVSVLEQTSTFVNTYEMESQMGLVDILIKPVMDEAGITTFNLFDTLVESGELAAKQQWEALKALAKRDHNTQEKPKVNSALPLKEFVAKKVVINGNKESSREFILGKLRFEDGDIVTTKKLDNGMDRLYGSGYFANIDYTLTQLDTGYQISFNVKEREELSIFKIGLNYNEDFNVALLLNFTKKNLFLKNSRLSADFAISENPRIYADYFIDRGLIPSFGLRFRSHRFFYRNYNQFEVGRQSVYQDFSLDLFVQSTILDAYALGGGVQLEDVDINQVISSNTDEELNSGYINYYGFIDFDSFDDTYFPRKGFQLKAKYRIIAARQGFETFNIPSSVFDIHYNQAYRLGNKLSLSTKAFGATTIGANVDFPYQIHFGSMGNEYFNYIEPFVGYRFMELEGRSGFYARGDLSFEFIKNQYIIARYNLGKLEPSFEELFTSINLLDGYSLSYCYNSPIGPLELNVATSSNHNNYYTYVKLGFWF